MFRDHYRRVECRPRHVYLLYYTKKILHLARLIKSARKIKQIRIRILSQIMFCFVILSLFSPSLRRSLLHCLFEYKIQDFSLDDKKRSLAAESPTKTENHSRQKYIHLISKCMLYVFVYVFRLRVRGRLCLDLISLRHPTNIVDSLSINPIIHQIIFHQICIRKTKNQTIGVALCCPPAQTQTKNFPTTNGPRFQKTCRRERQRCVLSTFRTHKTKVPGRSPSRYSSPRLPWVQAKRSLRPPGTATH